MATTAILPAIGNTKVLAFPRLARFPDVFANVFPHIPMSGMDSQHPLKNAQAVSARFGNHQASLTRTHPGLPDGQITRQPTLFFSRVQSPSKNILIFRNRKSAYTTHIPSHLRGGSRSSRTRDGMRWTRMVLLTRAPEADGEVVWS
jgi:hypothetical protein